LIRFTLIDYPNEGSFFKFLPSLKVQTQKNNFIYSNDQLYICNLKQHINQYPFMFVRGLESSSFR
jgi:hypothetical protein